MRAIEVEYNLDGFYVEFKQTVLVELMIYSRQTIYGYSSLNNMSFYLNMISTKFRSITIVNLYQQRISLNLWKNI